MGFLRSVFRGHNERLGHHIADKVTVPGISSASGLALTAVMGFGGCAGLGHLASFSDAGTQRDVASIAGVATAYDIKLGTRYATKLGAVQSAIIDSTCVVWNFAGDPCDPP